MLSIKFIWIFLMAKLIPLVIVKYKQVLVFNFWLKGDFFFYFVIASIVFHFLHHMQNYFFLNPGWNISSCKTKKVWTIILKAWWEKGMNNHTIILKAWWEKGMNNHTESMMGKRYEQSYWKHDGKKVWTIILKAWCVIEFF